MTTKIAFQVNEFCGRPFLEGSPGVVEQDKKSSSKSGCQPYVQCGGRKTGYTTEIGGLFEILVVTV
jgi:hypothetical protein